MLESAKTAFKKLVIERMLRQDAAQRAQLPGGFGGLPPSLWGCDIDAQGVLAIQGLSATELVRRFGSPLHVVNLPWLRKTHDEFLGAFTAHHPQTRLGTSYKTNPLPAVLKALHDCGTYAEVISEFELWLAGKLGLPGERIIVNGPGKHRAMIARAVDMGVKVINIDGLGEIEQIAAEAQRTGRTQPVGVRVVTSVGWSSQFGLAIANGDALAAFERIKQHAQLAPIGVHLHIGTGLKSVGLYLQAIREVLTFARVLRERHGIELSLYDFGGGYGVATVRGTDLWDDRMVGLGYPAREALPEDCPRPADYGARVAGLLNELLPKPAGVEMVLEPGRAITSGAQTLLLSVIAVKEGGGVRKLILDGGKNITLPLGWETHKMFPANRLRQPFDTRTDLYGPLCHPGDIVARHLQLPALAVGDVLAIMDAGAYFIPNQMNFSNPRPAVVSVESGKAQLVRQRESFEDVVRLDECT
jgi:diaminopimelate decarboxylase